MLRALIHPQPAAAGVRRWCAPGRLAGIATRWGMGWCCPESLSAAGDQVTPLVPLPAPAASRGNTLDLFSSPSTSRQGSGRPGSVHTLCNYRPSVVLAKYMYNTKSLTFKNSNFGGFLIIQGREESLLNVEGEKHTFS